MKENVRQSDLFLKEKNGGHLHKNDQNDQKEQKGQKSVMSFMSFYITLKQLIYLF